MVVLRSIQDYVGDKRFTVKKIFLQSSQFRLIVFVLLGVVPQNLLVTQQIISVYPQME